MLNVNFEKLKMYLLAGLLVYALSLILFSTESYAAFESLTKTGGEIFNGMKKIIFVAAGFGIIAIAIGAVFGALNWKWLSVIIIGVVVIAGTAALLKYLTQGTGAEVDVDVFGITDTLK